MPTWSNSSSDPIAKITRAKWTGGGAHSVECLLCKCKVLRSNLSPKKERKKKKKIRLTSLKTQIGRETENKEGNK
jgi:hypothetical protein